MHIADLDMANKFQYNLEMKVIKLPKEEVGM
jgi:hypothetical protein